MDEVAEQNWKSLSMTHVQYYEGLNWILNFHKHFADKELEFLVKAYLLFIDDTEYNSSLLLRSFTKLHSRPNHFYKMTFLADNNIC